MYKSAVDAIRRWLNTLIARRIESGYFTGQYISFSVCFYTLGKEPKVAFTFELPDNKSKSSYLNGSEFDIEKIAEEFDHLSYRCWLDKGNKHASKFLRDLEFPLQNNISIIQLINDETISVEKVGNNWLVDGEVFDSGFEAVDCIKNSIMLKSQSRHEQAKKLKVAN